LSGKIYSWNSYPPAHITFGGVEGEGKWGGAQNECSSIHKHTSTSERIPSLAFLGRREVTSAAQFLNPTLLATLERIEGG
jgi:hypothetical protein